MAKLCVEGMKATYSYCDQHNIPYKKVFILKVTECLSVCVTVAKVLKNYWTDKDLLLETSLLYLPVERETTDIKILNICLFFTYFIK